MNCRFFVSNWINLKKKVLCVKIKFFKKKIIQFQAEHFVVECKIVQLFVRPFVVERFVSNVRTEQTNAGAR